MKTLLLLIFLNSCTLRNFQEQEVLEEFFDEQTFTSQIELFTKISPTIELTDKIKLNFCIKDSNGIKDITIDTPVDIVSFDLNDSSPKITSINQDIYISNYNNNIPNPITGDFPISITYNNMSNQTITSNFIFKVKVKSPHFYLTLPPDNKIPTTWNNEFIAVTQKHSGNKLNYFELIITEPPNIAPVTNNVIVASQNSSPYIKTDFSSVFPSPPQRIDAILIVGAVQGTITNTVTNRFILTK